MTYKNLKGGSQCVCTQEYEPVCCNGKDFANPCQAECDGIKEPAEDQGICKSCPCPYDNNPSCCNGKDYQNECHAECNGIKKSDCYCLKGTC